MLQLVGVLVCLSLASAAAGQGLVGTWEGSILCKDARSKSSSRTDYDLLVSQEYSGGFERLHTELNGEGFFGMVFPKGGAGMLQPDDDAGTGFLTACTSAPDGSYTTAWPFHFKLKGGGGGKLKLSGSYTSPYGHGYCKGKFQRTSTTDPMIGDCP
jgi:hypothetical protein